MTKIRVKIGQLEIECEGSEDFIRDDLVNVITNIRTFTEELHSLNKNELVISAQSPRLQLSSPSQITLGTTTSIAARLKVNSAPDLIVAAAAKLTFSDGKETFSREDLHNEIKTAAGFYKKAHSSNFSQNLVSLLKGNKLNEVQKNIFSLSAATREFAEQGLS